MIYHDWVSVSHPHVNNERQKYIGAWIPGINYVRRNMYSMLKAIYFYTEHFYIKNSVQLIDAFKKSLSTIYLPIMATF